LDSYQHRCARCPNGSHGSLDRQPNDHLGRSKQPLSRLFQHRRQILRGCTSTYTNAYTDSISNSKSYADANWYCNGNTHRKPDADPALHR
jgi:hypothetical protein